MPRSKKRPKCLCGECGGEAFCRGLSRSCYSAARRDIELGKTTWKKLVDNGMALEATPAHLRRRTAIGKAIDALAAAGK